MNQPHPSDEHLLGLKGTALRVQDLLAIFGFRVRNPVTCQVVDQALKNVGLSTAPGLANCPRGAELVIVPAEQVTVDDEVPDTDEPSPGSLPQHSLRIGQIPAACKGLDHVTSNNLLTAATHMMQAKQYSQIPVIDGKSTLRGVVTWRSIAKLYASGKPHTLLNAMATDDLPVAEVHNGLIAHLPKIREHGYLLVRDNSGAFTGIVTTADITVRFEELARPFFLVGEIEFLLRKCLGAALAPDAIKLVQHGEDKKTGDIADLMFGQYVRLLDANQKNQGYKAQADLNWKALGWVSVDRTQFVNQLDAVRVIRNGIAHFDAEPISPTTLEKLEMFAALLRHLD